MGKQQAPKSAASNEGQPQTASKGYIVLSPFRDIANWDKAYEPGDDVSHFDKDRLKTLVANGIVQAPKAAAKLADPKNPTDEPPVGDEGGDAGDGGEGGDEGNGDEGDNGEE